MLSLESIGLLLGGIGLFLLGMDLMTDGLRSAAGNSLIRVLKGLTGNPVKGMLSGALATAVVQSSSATTLMTIGLVSAGVLSFEAAVGVVFGANVGTTMTSWLVSLVGLKFKISAFAYPFVGAGALMRALGRRRWKHLGAAVAGFGLLFVGIDLLQSGMAEVAEVIDTEALNPETFWGRTALVGTGLIMTVVMQSSSAAVASTLAALDAGAITTAAAAALVIGQNLGTTVTALIGGVGATIPAKRTAVAHVGFNVVAGLVAFSLFPLFEGAVVKLAQTAGASSPTTQIAAFHTAFNVLGLLVLLPFFMPFTRLVERLVPGRPRRYTSGLDDTTLAVPAVAILAAHDALFAVLKGVSSFALRALDSGIQEDEAAQLDEEFSRLRGFLLRIVTDPSDAKMHQVHVDTLHALDHVERAVRVLLKASFYEQAKQAGDIGALTDQLRAALQRVVSDEGAEMDDVAWLAAASQDFARQRASYRVSAIDRAAHGDHDSRDLPETLHYVVRIDRVLFHTWRAYAHLVGTSESGQLHDHDEEKV